MSNLNKLLYLRGVAEEYLDYSGNLQEVSWGHRLRLLEAMGYDSADVDQIDKAVYQLDAEPWLQSLNSLYVVSGEEHSIEFHCHPQRIHEPVHWVVVTESKQEIYGDCIPSSLQETGEYYLGQLRYIRYRLPIELLPYGYHSLVFLQGERSEQAQVISTPQQCFDLYKESEIKNKIWGVSCQLYTLRSTRNWGVGDFTDLRQLIELSAERGADIVAINPLHAPSLIDADSVSPYSPSDRRFLNTIYLDPQAVQEFYTDSSLEAWFLSEEVEGRLEKLRQATYVDYEQVSELKYSVFEKLYITFLQQHLKKGTERAKEFELYVAERGEALLHFSRFEAKNNRFFTDREPYSQFHQYLQWLAVQQLESCQQRAIACGMKVGLMRDLAIGSIANGSEVSSYPQLFNDVATIGAPPDPFAADGQNWDLPAIDPVAMRKENYQHFIQLLRANMASCGALRIDHVMGLMRLWWCLSDIGREGAYVYYPFETLMAILRLESHRNQCMIIGEDMGVVPDQLRHAMRESSLYSNNLFYFETDFDGRIKHPSNHQLDALLMVTNHDVSTLAGWWNGRDLYWRDKLGLDSSEKDHDNLSNHRNHQKQQLLDWLVELSALPESWSGKDVLSAFDLALCASIHGALAKSHSRLMLLQIDDLQLIEDPVNIPGTYREYPNWRRKQCTNTTEIFNQEPVQWLLNSVNKERFN